MTSYLSRRIFAFWIIFAISSVHGSPEESRLIGELFFQQGYNPLVRPVPSQSQQLTVGFELALIQIISVNEKNQVMKTNVWLRMVWKDYQLTWDPAEHGNITMLRIPSDLVWIPDIVLFNNADGKFRTSYEPNVLIEHTGHVLWIPCAIYLSACTIDVTYFPFDEQRCQMIFGSWSFSSDQVNLTWYDERKKERIDLNDYEESGSWDLIGCPGKQITVYDSLEGSEKSQTLYTVVLRRKPLFYVVNLIVPCVLISFLNMAVFYLPVDDGEKVSIGVSLLLALVVFLQLIVTNLLPPNSISIPLFAKYLLFAVVFNVAAIVSTVVVLHLNFRMSDVSLWPRWIRILLFRVLPKVLFVRYQTTENVMHGSRTESSHGRWKSRYPGDGCESVHHPNCIFFQCAEGSQGQSKDEEQAEQGQRVQSGKTGDDRVSPWTSSHAAVGVVIKQVVGFITGHLKTEHQRTKVSDQWRLIASLVDRFMLIVYGIVLTSGTIAIIVSVPHIFINPDTLSEGTGQRM